MRVSQRARAEVPWSAPYIYNCANRHHIEADAPVAQCPAYDRGSPCDGELTQVGANGGRVRSGAST